MNKVIRIIALLGLITATTSAQEAMAYFPDQVGDSWVRQTDFIAGAYNLTHQSPGDLGPPPHCLAPIA